MYDNEVISPMNEALMLIFFNYSSLVYQNVSSQLLHVYNKLLKSITVHKENVFQFFK